MKRLCPWQIPTSAGSVVYSSPENAKLRVPPFANPEILTPGTPRVSLGTKFFSSKIFSFDINKLLFHVFWGFVMPKLPKNGKD